MSTPDLSRPVQRYGKEKVLEKPKGMAGKVVATIFVIVIAAILVLGMRTILTRDSSPIEASLVNHERIDDQTSRVWIDVAREDTSQPSYCIIAALNYSMAEVGRRDVVIPAGGEALMRISADLPVREYPVSGSIYGCSSNVPSFLNTEDPVYDVARSG
ncbi:DUF4307 domain-containing protein [Corynebacterium cystitidis]|uniref:DUF4307 domain-containing protein n=1 Tax=Corynebacterium cystitidis DSM 20524 TaxID=1121357 RepID=A0A1H9TMQ5_9CORY|nr:DUF4307 domain-containing protein [Corynebacterium cystitidis]WJY82029.1 hypothetical protein CCYS_05440 [Corynebacterium cystitidis DSM 20524]SER98445.1 protein of unknown function [Corynebacterium cystitidis DSM 20524]SNV80587.1 putative secreted protein [Corynebacterium cystitidis]